MEQNLAFFGDLCTVNKFVHCDVIPWAMVGVLCHGTCVRS